MPMASTIPKSDKLFSENPNSFMNANVPISETGMASSGTSDARQLWRKTSTTMTTSAMASSSVMTTSRMLDRTKSVVS
jgi:hypothetical protein